MGEWIKKNPVLYAMINLALCILVVSLTLKMYVDYRVDEKMIEIETKLNRIESSTDTILEIIQNTK